MVQALAPKWFTDMKSVPGGKTEAKLAFSGFGDRTNRKTFHHGFVHGKYPLKLGYHPFDPHWSSFTHDDDL